MQVAVLECTARGEAVHQVIDGIDALHGPDDGRGVQEIPLHHLHVVPPRTAVEALGVPRQAPHPVARSKEAWHQAPSDIAGGARDKDMLRIG